MRRHDKMTSVLDVDASTPHELGLALAARHSEGRHAGPSLHEYVERPHADDWSMRAALVRYAQPEPVRASAVLDLTRRCDSGLADVAKAIETDPTVSDLARAHLRAGDDWPAVLDAYLHEAEPPEPDVLDRLPVLAVAAQLDELGATLAAWALDPSQPRPDDEVDRVCRAVHGRLEELGVERQEWYR